MTGLGDCFDLEVPVGQGARLPAGRCASGISLVAGAEGQGGVAPEEQGLKPASFFVSCDATTGEYAAVRHSTIAVLRNKSLERYVLKGMASPIVNMSVETITASLCMHRQESQGNVCHSIGFRFRQTSSPQLQFGRRKIAAKKLDWWGHQPRLADRFLGIRWLDSWKFREFFLDFL